MIVKNETWSNSILFLASWMFSKRIRSSVRDNGIDSQSTLKEKNIYYNI